MTKLLQIYPAFYLTGARKTMNPPNPPTTIFAATDIAKELSRTPTAVINAIRRMKIQPSQTCGKRFFYEPEVIEVLRTGMRKRNREGPRYAYYLTRKATQD